MTELLMLAFPVVCFLVVFGYLLLLVFVWALGVLEKLRERRGDGGPAA